MKRFPRLVAISLAISIAASGAAFAQQSETTTPPPAKTDVAPMDKAAISKACSQQADAKGLKGKARKHFRAKCKKNGGKTE